MRENSDLRAEYLLIQGMYEAYDQRALSLKALATPLLGAGAAVGIKEASHAILLATLLVAICLWLLEAMWKCFQYCLTARVELLEAWYRGDGDDGMAPFQIYTAWSESWRRHYRKPSALLPILAQPFVALPYAIIAAGCAILMVVI